MSSRNSRRPTRSFRLREVCFCLFWADSIVLDNEDGGAAEIGAFDCMYSIPLF